MTYLAQPRLVNEPFYDPVLLLDFRFGRRALLFDLGDLSALSAREIIRVSHVFVSHMHMDHFAGFDRLLRLFLYQSAAVRLLGPPGLCDAVEAKLRAYTWNLLDTSSVDFVLLVDEWTPKAFARSGVFRARTAFACEQAEPPQLRAGLMAEDPEFLVEGAMLDHGIPSLAFAFQEKVRVNVQKPRLDTMGLPVGPWLTEAKRAVRRGADPGTGFSVDGRDVTLGELMDAHALRTAPGQRVVFATDLAYHAENAERLVALARNADRLYIEAGFLDEDRAVAASKRHLTAAQAGDIARAAGVATAVPMHFSGRYAEREDELRREFEFHFRGHG